MALCAELFFYFNVVIKKCFNVVINMIKESIIIDEFGLKSHIALQKIFKLFYHHKQKYTIGGITKIKLKKLKK